MKLFICVLSLLLSCSATYADSISWDGPGLTFNELLHAQGQPIDGLDFSGYTVTQVLYEITALDKNNQFTVTGNTLTYFTGLEWYRTDTHPQQFTYITRNGKWIVGVEDLQNGDWDYNDYVVVLERPVPEPITVLLLGLGLVGTMIRRRV